MNLKGMDSAIANLRRLSKSMQGQVNREAAYEGAEILASEIIRQSPRGSFDDKPNPKKGHIAQNIIIYERKRKDTYTEGEQNASISLLVGPNKKAFHAYFYEHGRAGFEVKPDKERGKKALHWIGGGKDIFSRGHKVGPQQPNQFIKRAFDAKADAAKQAMIEVYRDAVKGLTNG
jgi:HK97 gp10 family phage protein